MLRTAEALVFIFFAAFTAMDSVGRDALYVCANSAAEPSFNGRTEEKISCISNKPNSSTHKINIWVMAPFDDYYVFSMNHVKPAVYQALRDANATLCDDVATEDQSGISDSICYAVAFNDTRCEADFAMTQAVAVRDSTIVTKHCSASGQLGSQGNLDVIVGMSCDYCAGRIGALAANWEWPVIFVGTRNTSMDNKSLSCCTTLTRTGHTATDLGNFVYALHHKYDWSNSYFVYSGITNHGVPVLDQVLSDCATMTGGVASVLDGRNFSDYVLRPVGSDEELLESAEDILQQIKFSARVSIWCVGRKTMRSVMNTAHRMGMTGDATDELFAFFYIDLYNTNTSFQWSDADDQPCSPAEYCDKDFGNSSAGMRALQVITLHKPETAQYEEFSNKMKIEMDQIKPELGGTHQFVNPYVPEYYNAIRLVVNGVQKSAVENSTDWSDGTRFARRLWNTSFPSVDGEIVIAESGDQVMNYALMDMNEVTETFEVAAVYYGINSSWISVRQIDWPGLTNPPSELPCEISGSCHDSVDKLSRPVAELIAFAVILAILLTVIFFKSRRKFNRERKLREMTWKVKPVDLVYGARERRMSLISSSSSLSEPIASAPVVNRPLLFKTGYWNNHFVAVKHIKSLKKVDVDRELQVEMDMLVSINHEHICRIYGASVEEPILMLMEHCSRGTLQDFVEGDMFEKLDDVFANSLILDIAQGMQFLHKTSVHSHGNLKSSNCLLTSRLVVKISGFGLASFRPRVRRDSVIGCNHCKDLLWTAPELLRADKPPVKGTQNGDIYSFAIVVQEILYTMGPFYLGETGDEEKMSPNEICRRVQENFGDIAFRPTLKDDDDVVLSGRMRSLVEECWSENPESRPAFHQIVAVMKKYAKKKNLFDQMLRRLEQYSTTLEDKVEERTMQYKAEKERADKLLYQMLPKGVTDKLKRGQNIEPCKFDSVTIYFSDIVGFTAISHESTPLQVVDMLDSLYTVFDEVVDLFDVYKVETIGDAYMVVSGLPETNGKQHVREISRMALRLIKEVKRFKIPHMTDNQIELRVGIHSGPVVAGVVGKKMPRYCLFGDTVNTAARMEQNGQRMRIHISPTTKSLLDEFGSFDVSKREDPVTLKGLGQWQTWWLEDEIVNKDSPLKYNTTDEANCCIEKKTSSCSEYSSVHSSLQESMHRVRLSVTGLDERDSDSAHEVKWTPDFVTCEEESCRRESHLYSLREGVEVKQKRRRTGVNEIPKELLDERLRLEQKLKDRSTSGLKNLVPAEYFNLKVGRKVKFDETNGGGRYFSGNSKKERRKMSCPAFYNSTYAPEDYEM